MATSSDNVLEEWPLLQKAVLVVMLSLVTMLLLMGALYWSEISLLLRLYDSSGNFLATVLDRLFFYSWSVGITVGVVSLLIILYSIQTIRSLGEPMNRYRMAASIAREEDNEQLELSLNRWMYHQIKWRILALVIGSITIVVILMGSLYVATLHLLISRGIIDRSLADVVQTLLYNYSWIIGIAILFTTFLFSFLSLKLSMQLTNYSDHSADVPDEYRKELESEGPVSVDDLKEKLDRILLGLQLEQSED